MKFLYKRVPFFILFIYIFSSCVSSKEITYFQYDSLKEERKNSYNLILKPADLVQIVVTTEDYETAQVFNAPVVSSNEEGKKRQAYLIDNKGYINFPIIGNIKIGGLTREKAIEVIHNKLSPDFLKKPSISIRVVNFKITVLGDVNKPGTFTLDNERITVLEAIGLAGDLNISGKRSTVTVVRESNDEIKKYNLDLLSNNIFSSPAFYLQQNDVVYVEHNKASIQSANHNKNTGLYVSIASLLLSVITIISR